MFLQVAAAAVSQMIFSPAVLIFAKAAFLGPGGKPHQRKNQKKTGRGNKQVKKIIDSLLVPKLALAVHHSLRGSPCCDFSACTGEMVNSYVNLKRIM